MTSHRIKRPHLERDRPLRTWATLFPATAPSGPPGTRRPGDAAGETEPFDESARGAGPASAPPLGDLVEQGYRVINEYMRQGQAVAQGFSPTPGASAERSDGAPDMQQLTQRVMQYGWDFAGLWFEMWTRMSGNLGVAPPGPPGAHGGPSEAPSAARPGAAAPPAAASGSPRVAVSIACQRRTTVFVDLRQVPPTALAVHALRAEGTEFPPLRDVTVEAPAGSDTITVTVRVPAEQPPAVYNGLIVEASSNLPRGTLSVTIHGEQQG